jgi:adenylylsulfate kinase-like enzyme
MLHWVLLRVGTPRDYTKRLGLERSRVSPYFHYWKWDRSWLPEFTGVSAPYEAPPNPEIHIKTDEVDVKGAVEIICKYLVEKNIIPA